MYQIITIKKAGCSVLCGNAVGSLIRKEISEMNKQIMLSGFADELAPALDRQIEGLQKLGMQYVEMRGVDGKGLVEYSPAEAKEIKKRLDAGGIRLSSVGSPIGKIGIADEFALHMELFKNTVEIAHVMECPNIRMFSFFIPDEEKPEQYREAVTDRLGQFVEYASANDVVLLHENEKGIYGAKASECLDLMKNFYGKHFKAVFDFANFVQVHQDTLEAYEMLKPYIAYVHVKDAKWADGSVVPAGYGDGNVKAILTDLLAGGYHGFLSLEPHLADFTGFGALEKEGRIGNKLSGEEAFTLAHDSLVKILEEI